MKSRIALALLLSLPLLGSTAPVDSGPCAGMAKYGAIRAYKAEAGAVQGSDGIQYSAVLTGERGDYLSYLVSISDNNEDGDAWEVDYSVVISKRNNTCQLLSVKKTAERSL